MCAKMAFQHQAGTAMECLSIPITLHKEPGVDHEGREVLKCGFKIGGGIDQDYKKSPQGYTDNIAAVWVEFHFRPTIAQWCKTPYFQKKLEPPWTYNYKAQIGGIYVTEVHEGSPASKSGLRMHDKILQCNGYDFTMVTHKKAVDYIKKHPILNLLVARKGVTSS